MVSRLGETARHAIASKKRCSRLRKTDIYENWVGKSVGRGRAEWRCWPINFRSSEISVDFAPAVCKFFSAPASRAARTKPTGRPGRTIVFREVASRAGEARLFVHSDLKRIALKAQHCNSSQQIHHFLKWLGVPFLKQFRKMLPSWPRPPWPRVAGAGFP